MYKNLEILKEEYGLIEYLNRRYTNFEYENIKRS